MGYWMGFWDGLVFWVKFVEDDLVLGNATTGGGQVLALLVQLALDPPQRALAATGSPLDLLQESLGLSQSSDGTRQGSISSGLGGGRSLARALSLLTGSSGLGSGLLSSWIIPKKKQTTNKGMRKKKEKNRKDREGRSKP